MVQNYNFFVKPQSKNQPFSKKTLKTADFCHCFCITDVFILGHYCPVIIGTLMTKSITLNY